MVRTPVVGLGLLALVGACVEPAITTEAAPSVVGGFTPPVLPPPILTPPFTLPPLPPIHVITENADGTFSPMWTYAHDGDFVLWALSSRTDAVVPVTWSGAWPAPCSTPKPWDPADVNNITGPRPQAETGVFALSPVPTVDNPAALGFVSQPTACPAGTEAGHQTDYLCRTGAPFATAASTWSDPEIDGVFVRLLWNQVEPADCSSSNLATCWDWSVVDREVSAAVANGKLYSISVKAGDDGTPDWLFTTDPDDTPRVGPTGGVTRLHLRDSGNDRPGCGTRMDLGDPTEAAYQAQYFDMLTALAAHLQTRSDWYRALAAVKPSGANLQSHENRLPKRCDAGCVCNTQILAARGYTPAGLYDFYQQQFDLLAALFPGKAQSYALIQQGFPRIAGPTCYQIEDSLAGTVQASAGCAGGVGDLPLPAEQTDAIMALGAATAATAAVPYAWSVSHNGLGPTAPANRQVLEAAAADTTTLTGFQTNNATGGVPDAAALDATFVNLETAAIAPNAPESTWLEIYEERQWEVQQQGGVVDPAGSGRTLGGWGQLLRDRRDALFPAYGAASPSYHLVRVHYTIGGGNQIIHFVDPSKCAGPAARYGALSISP
ncbi:MAG: hypothetical protein R3B06_09795 [Kofleriaceae bacterium]